MRTIIAADVGSLTGKRFAWATSRDDLTGQRTSTNFDELTAFIGASLAEGSVELGLEAPLFLPDDPQTERPESLTRAIDESPGGRVLPWNAGAGASSLVTGITQLYRICTGLAEANDDAIKRVGTSPGMPHETGTLRVWEAFVSGAAKRTDPPKDDRGDAINAVTTLIERADLPSEVIVGEKLQLRNRETSVNVINVPQLVLESIFGREGDFSRYQIVRPTRPAAPSVYERFTC